MLTYFDSNVCVGKRGRKDYRELWRSRDILNVMDRTGISAALVYAGWAKDYAPLYGNERLMQELEISPRFYGCYTIMPGDAGNFPSAEDFVSDMRKKGMVAAKMFPVTHYYTPNEVTMGAYYTALENAGIPLLVDFAEIGWANLESILTAHPKLNVLVQGVYWSDNSLFAYMKKFDNLYMDLCNFQVNYAIEVLVEMVGAHRLVFGSALPKMTPGAARGFIDYADISDADKQLIAGGNLARLCNVKLPDAIHVADEPIAREAESGKPLSVPVIDSHTHFLEDGGGFGGGTPMLKGDLEHMLALGEKMGVDKHCVAPWLGIWTDSEAGNCLAENMAERDSRVYPYVLIDPNYVAREDIGKIAYHYHIQKRMPAMKMFMARINTRYNHPMFDPWLEIANDNHLYALMDSGSYPNYLADMAELAEKYPNISLFLDHAGRDFATAEAYAELAKKYDNVYLQLTYTSVPEGLIEYLCREGLAEKTLYGTDAPMRDPRPQLGWVAHADITTQEKKLILGGNMQRILDRCFKK